MKHGGGSIVNYSCSSAGRKVTLIKVNGRNVMKTYKHQSEKFRSLLMKLYFTFQHDHDPKHTSKSTKELLNLNKINVIEWLSRKPRPESN